MLCLLSLGAFVLSSSWAAVQAQDGTCARYARESIRQNQENMNLGSGFAPPVWSSDFAGHNQWCLQGNNRKTTPGFLRDREQKLQEFALKQGDPCARYAAQSVRQYQANVAMNIGFKPPVWSGDYNSHYNWCRQGGNAAATPRHLAAREEQMQAFALAKDSEYTSAQNANPSPDTGASGSPGATGVSSPPAYGAAGTTPAAQAIQGAKLITKYPDHCHNGPGHCLWIVPYAEYRRDFQELSTNHGPSVQSRNVSTGARISFTGNRLEGNTYACAYVTANFGYGTENPPDVIKVERPNYALQSDANEVPNPGIVGLFGDCSTFDAPKTGSSGDLSWRGMIIVASNEPFLMSAYATVQEFRNVPSLAGEVSGSLMTAKLPASFISGTGSSTPAAYPIDCRNPRGYEGVCEFGLHLLERIGTQ